MRILHQFHQASTEMSEWLQLAASVLARAAQNLAVVTAPRTRTVKLKHVQLVELNESAVLMIVVTEDIKVHQQMVTLPEPMGQEAEPFGGAAEPAVGGEERRVCSSGARRD